MAKAPSAQAGPSRPNGGRPLKPIHKTVDLLRSNEGAKRKGKGKEKEVLGDGVMGLVDDVKRLPGMIQVEKFAETRALEIHAFQTAIKVAAAQGSTRAFQSLPRHLRRRAASHNPRRVPKRLRSKAAAEIDSGDTIAKKHRKIARLRRKGTLRDHLSRTEQFALRQKNKTWLPTHMWHAKRYHMTNLWGYRLPLTPTLKSFRPAYRAGRRKAIGFDTSYHGIIEFEGSREEIISVLGRMSGGRFAGSKYEDGSRVANILLYHFGSFPTNLIGPAEVIWQTPTPDIDLRPRIWLRLHPSIFNETWDALKVATAQLQQSGSSRIGDLQIRDLRGEINSIDLIGPKSGKVLRRVLRLCRDEKGVKSKFFESLRDLDDPAQLTEGMIVGLNVHDPRLNFPPSRLSPKSEDMNEQAILRFNRVQPSPDLAQSTLWDSNVREDLSKAAYTKYQLDARRHRLGLPGTKLRPLSTDDRLPIILLQRSISSPSNPSEGFYGFTILLPPGTWAQYFLSSLVYSGTLFGGLRERAVQHREAGVSSFPEHYGQTCKAGREWEVKKGDKEKETFDRKPPGKRPDFGLMGTQDPWIPDWNEVMSNQSSEESTLNDSGSGAASKPWLLPSPFTSHLTPNLNPASLLKLLNAFRNQRSLAPLPSEKGRQLFDSALVHVEVNILGRGSPGDMAILCTLTKEERVKWIEAYEKGDQVDSGELSDLHKLGEVIPSQDSVIGYTTTGNFSLSRGQGYALGAITLKSYIDLLKTAGQGDGHEYKDGWEQKVLVRVKNRDGRLSRLAELKLILN
ncbi:ribonuclease P/MRP protein subunit POP1 [Kwoniella mangroviensis CBS 10435]|uniref:Ribonuclease P/MRP protein subunit POP1 n=1 Tax=Kwoniella mangroviensis CBS 10435 TaxID=1331196 RepID=A0A1B9IZF8_9TREE|nr:ribonuclease P/MRP protein subunit POP1 [Kwoniella mangroviensis CBS 10435]